MFYFIFSFTSVFIVLALVEIRFQKKIKTINQGKNIRAAEDFLNRLLSSKKPDWLKQQLLRDCYSDPVAFLKLDQNHLAAEHMQTIKQMIEQHLSAAAKKK